MSGSLRVTEQKAVPREGVDAMGPSPSPSLGASGAGLGAATWLCPSPNSPGLSSSPVLPPHQRMITPFSPAPPHVGCRLSITIATKLPLPVGLGLSGRWEGRASVSCVCIYERSCGCACRVWVQACVCTHGGGVVCGLLCGSELLWVCPCAQGPRECGPV